MLPIKMRPGINTQKPLLMNEGGWSTSQLVRFKDGMPQALGGWTKWWSYQFPSPPRVLLSWADLDGVPYTANGTDTSLYVIANGGQTDITPLTVTTNPAPALSTTSGSTTVEVPDNSLGQISGTFVNFVVPVSVGGLILEGIYPIQSITSIDTFNIDAASAATATVTSGGAVPLFTTTASSVSVNVQLDNHGLAIGDSFSVAVSTTVGGITLEGTYLVQTIVDTNNFTIDSPTAATSGATASENGGDLRLVYYGTTTSGSGTNYGYGIGGYGNGGYGQGSPYTPGALPVVPLWTVGNWGETLIFCAGQGSIFTWTPRTGETVGQLLTAAPTVNSGIFIAMPELTLVAWGASVNGVQQPLLVSWSTVGDYTVWGPLVTNQAGSFTIPSGSRIMGGMQGPQQALIWTDVDLYAMNYLGGSGGAALAWGFNKIADHCGLIAPRAACILNDAVFWISAPGAMTDAGPPSGGQVMVFAGGEGVVPIHCDVWDVMFQDLDWANAHKILAAPNSLFHEVAWYFPSLSGGTGECDKYIKYNTVERTWDYGSLARTAWQDMSAVGNPIGGGADGYLYQHEIGTSAAGLPLDWSIGTGAIMIAEGENMAFCDWILPEFRFGLIGNANTNSPVNVTIAAYRYTTDTTPLRTQTRTFEATGPGFSTVRLRGRHLTLQFGAQGFARIGDFRLRIAQDGKY